MHKSLKYFSNTREGQLIIKNVIDRNLNKIDIVRPYYKNLCLDGTGLLLLPNIIDPHVHFRVPGREHKEDWITGSRAAFKGGYTTVFDMPNVIPPTTTLERLVKKKEIINEHLGKSRIPLSYKLWFGVDLANFEELDRVNGEIFGLKIFMTESVSDSCINKEKDLYEIFKVAAKNNYIISAHAEDDSIIKENYQKFNDLNEYKYHSCVHSIEAAVCAIEKLIKFSKQFNVPTYVLHVSTKNEIELIKAAKSDGIPIYAETCPHYLFLNDQYYNELQGKVKMNPPVRKHEDQVYLWSALKDGSIDTLASDHAPHTLSEKNTNIRAKCPSGVPGIETTLPLILTEWRENRIELSRIIDLLHTNPKKIFNLNEKDEEFILVNIDEYKILKDEDLATKVKWSPFSGRKLTGFPKFIFTNQELYDIDLI